MPRLVVPAAYPMGENAADDGLPHSYVTPNPEAIEGPYRLAFSLNPVGGYLRTGPFAVSIYDKNGQVFSVSLETIRISPPPQDDDIEFEPFELTTAGGVVSHGDMAVTGSVGVHRLYATFEWKGVLYEAYSNPFFLAALPIAVILLPPYGSIVGSMVGLLGSVDDPTAEVLIYRDGVYIGKTNARGTVWDSKVPTQ